MHGRNWVTARVWCSRGAALGAREEGVHRWVLHGRAVENSPSIMPLFAGLDEGKTSMVLHAMRACADAVAQTMLFISTIGSGRVAVLPPVPALLLPRRPVLGRVHGS